MPCFNMEIIECKFILHLLDLTRSSCEKLQVQVLTGIEPTATEYYTEGHLHCFLRKRYSS
jgi:hypothetical protein